MNQTIFKSKVGYGLLVFVIVIVAGTVLFPLTTGAPVEALIVVGVIVLPMLLLVFDVSFRTRYEIFGERLIVNCGSIYKVKLRISDIYAIEKTRNPISAPAPSLDRILIHYSQSDSIIISPRDKRAFVDALLSINPNIRCEFS